MSLAGKLCGAGRRLNGGRLQRGDAFAPCVWESPVFRKPFDNKENLMLKVRFFLNEPNGRP